MATIELILVAPLVVLGIVLTLSLFGAIFGLPLLAFVVPVALVSTRIRNTPGDLGRRDHFRWASLALAGVMTVVLGLGVAVGAGDVDRVVEYALLSLALAWTTGAWWVWRASHRWKQ